MQILKKNLLAFGIIVGVSVGGVVTLNQTAHALADKVVAKVDGVEIWQSELAFAKIEIGSELARVPVIERDAVLLRYVIDIHLMAAAAKKDKLDSLANFKKRQAYYQLKALKDSYVEKAVNGTVGDAQARKIYDKIFGSKKEKIEVRASHILVKKEQEAKDIKKALAGGADFAKLAAEKSTGPSKTQGGDLGFFTKGRMVKAFEKAAFSLEKNGISEPIKTQFGWHVIKVTDKRKKPNPPFEVVKSRILAPLITEKSRAVIEALRKTSKTEILDETIKKHMQDVE